MSAYTPGPFSYGADRTMVRELYKVSAADSEPRPVVFFAPTAVEPSKPRDGMTVRAIAPWDPGYGYGLYQFQDGEWVPAFGASQSESVIVVCSNETSNLSTGTAKVTFRMPYPFAIDEVRANVNTAPTGSTIVVDINKNGASILSTKLSIDAGEKTSVTAATAAVISDPTCADDDEMTIDVDAVGSTIAGKGLKVTIIGRHTT